jgi:hypothetical protein
MSDRRSVPTPGKCLRIAQQQGFLHFLEQDVCRRKPNGEGGLRLFERVVPLAADQRPFIGGDERRGSLFEGAVRRPLTTGKGALALPWESVEARAPCI